MKRSAGGAHKATTVRAFDMELIRWLSPATGMNTARISPELRLVEVRAKRLDAGGMRRDRELRRSAPGSLVTVFSVVPCTPPASGGVTVSDPPINSPPLRLLQGAASDVQLCGPKVISQTLSSSDCRVANTPLQQRERWCLGFAVSHLVLWTEISPPLSGPHPRGQRTQPFQNRQEQSLSPPTPARGGEGASRPSW